MPGTNNISQYTLEMYQLGLASPKERKLVEAALASDTELRLRYEALAESDREIRRRYPPENMPAPAALRDATGPARESGLSGQGAIVRGRFSARKRLFVGLGVAAGFVCALFLSLNNLRSLGGRPTEIASVPNNGTGWARGTENNTRDFSISIYPLETQAALSQTEYEDGLPDGTLLKEGDSLLLAYTTPPGGEYEGVVFAINGTGTDVTMLFPADMRDRPKLADGGEALRLRYIPDSAPDFEIFFLVASPNPLDVEAVIKTANEAIAGELLAGESGRSLEAVLEKIYSTFESYVVKYSYINIAK